MARNPMFPDVKHISLHPDAFALALQQYPVDSELVLIPLHVLTETCSAIKEKMGLIPDTPYTLETVLHHLEVCIALNVGASDLATTLSDRLGKWWKGAPGK